MMTIQNYVRAQSLEEAWQLNQRKRNRILGGMLWLKMSSLSVATAIDMCDLGLNTVTETDDTVSVGAMVTLRQLETDPILDRCSGGAVAAAVKDIVGVQFRNSATVGGSLWGRFGFSDVLTLFMAMDASVELYKGGLIPLEQFASMKPDRDILVRLVIPKKPGRFAYSAVRVQRTDFPVINTCLAHTEDGWKAVIGARPFRSVVVKDENGLLAADLTPETIKAFAAFVADRVPTFGNMRGSAAYRSRLIRTLVERTVSSMGGDL